MHKAQVLLREDQKAELERVSRQTGRKKSELIRRGVDLALAEAVGTEAASKAAPVAPDMPDWKKAWLDAAGIWKDRDDLDELYSDMRKRSRERMERLEKQWREP